MKYESNPANQTREGKTKSILRIQNLLKIKTQDSKVIKSAWELQVKEKDKKSAQIRKATNKGNVAFWPCRKPATFYVMSLAATWTSVSWPLKSSRICRCAFLLDD